jgi:hypothetical protein
MTSISISSVSSATTYATQQAGTRPPHRDGKNPMESVAKALGMSTDDLKSALKSGQSMSDLADAAGVSHDDLIAAIKAGMPAKVDKASDDATAMAEKIASTKGLPPARGGRHGGDGDGDSAVVGNSSKLSQLSSLFNLDSSGATSLSSATSASQLLKVLQQNGVDLGKLKSVLNSGDLLDTTA